MRRVGRIVCVWLLVSIGLLAAVQRIAGDTIRLHTRDRYAHRISLGNALDRPGRRPLVAWMGDSTLLLPVHARVPELVEERIRAHAPVEVRIVAGKGFDFYAHYFVLERVLALAPDLVVLTANLRLLEPNPDAPGWYDDLASALPPRELPRAIGLPLAPARLTAVRLLMMQCLRLRSCEAGALDLDDFRSWANDTWRDASTGLFGPERRVPPPTMHDVLHKFYDVSLTPESTMMRMLGATVRRVRAAGIPVLVYLSPVPVHVLHAEGLDDPDRRHRDVAAVRAVTEAAGGRFVDLHEALGAGEVDEMAHYTVRGAQRLAEMLTLVVVNALGGTVAR